jgi:hypothetical protein
MADVQITVDATKALAKLDHIPLAVRNNLRGIIPDLTKQLGALVNAKLDTELKSRTRIQVKQELVENPTSIYGRVAAVWTGDSKSAMVPQVLESGARAHEIVAVNAQALSFFWEKMGKNVMFKRVMHPGFPGIHYMANSFAEMRSDIVSKIRTVVLQGAKDAK